MSRLNRLSRRSGVEWRPLTLFISSVRPWGWHRQTDCKTVREGRGQGTGQVIHAPSRGNRRNVQLGDDSDILDDWEDLI